MKSYSTLLFVVILALSGCSKVPITGRTQFTAIPESQLIGMSAQEYNNVLSQSQVVTGTADANTVKTVGSNISSAVGRVLTQLDLAELVEGYQWEYNLVKDDVVNAWCMAGGKIVFYTGIMPVCKDANGVAVVMGHEVAHAVAKHGNERMSQLLAAQLGGVALDVALNNQPEQTRNLLLTAYGVGSQVGILLPYSRKQELEADKLGLVFMADAGYDPNSAVGFWERMEAMAGGGAPPEFLSTHPSHSTRIKQILNYMPEAMKYYKPK
ncbi:MAG: M48 family metallopeptidase [Bacteroidota bacterium]|nr:M48 family metallopeptidase [Bacteroidota bacterium]